MWYTPKHDARGRLIDPIGKTPAERPEKAGLMVLAEMTYFRHRLLLDIEW
jgi:hypothetical protein